MELSELAAKMLSAAKKYPKTAPDEYSSSLEEAIQVNIKEDDGEFGKWQLEVGLAAGVRYEAASQLSLTISLDTYRNPVCYTLSMVRWTGQMVSSPLPFRVASAICDAFFGAGKWREVENPSAFAHGRFFESDA